MSTPIGKNSIFDFKVRKDEIDLAKSVPKLKGLCNWREWEAQMFTKLGSNNPVYVQLIKDDIKMPSAPIYADPSHSSVRALLLEEAEGNNQKETCITEKAIEARSIQIIVSNIELRNHHADGEQKWERANNRALSQFLSTLSPEVLSGISDTTNVREAYLELKGRYWSSSHQATYSRFMRFLNIRYMGGNPRAFVIRFKRVLGDYTAFVGQLTALQELCHFKMAVSGNYHCRMFIPNLTINEDDPDLMDQVYHDFVAAVELH